MSPDDLTAARWPLARAAASPRNEPARRVRGRRRPVRQHQARGLRRRRRLHCGGVRAPGPAGVKRGDDIFRHMRAHRRHHDRRASQAEGVRRVREDRRASGSISGRARNAARRRVVTARPIATPPNTRTPPAIPSSPPPSPASDGCTVIRTMRSPITDRQLGPRFLR